MAPDSFALFGPIDIPSNAYNSYRVYGSALLLFMFICVFIGVKFVSKFSPIALFCVLGSIVCVYVGIFMANPDRGPQYVDLSFAHLKVHLNKFLYTPLRTNEPVNFVPNLLNYEFGVRKFDSPVCLFD
jgi:hypothetical protein